MRKIFRWLLLLCLPKAFQRCIFDDIQPWVRAVSPPPNQPTSPKHTGDSQSRNTDPKAPPRTDRVLSQEHQRIIRQITAKTQSNSSGLLPIRIRTWIPQESFALSHAERERLELAASKAVRIVSDILSVDRIPGRMLLSRDINKFCKFIWKDATVTNYNKCARANENYRMENCLDVTIPDDHLSGCGVYLHPNSQTVLVLRPEGRGLPDTDFVLYLHTCSTDKCHAEPGVLAYAAHCQTDRRGRPLAGVVVICRSAFHGEGYSHSRMVQTITHELFHVLGFSKELFDTWKDCSHSPRIGEDCLSHGQVTNVDGTGQVRIYTPSVIRAMQKHSGSSEDELGGPLENVAANEPSSHWEARVLQGSIMTAALDRPELVRVDPLTLAALQDTGWYQVNQSAAQRMEWGEGQGSLFGSLATCHDNSSTFFCTGSGLGCHYLHLHKGVCQSDQYLEGCRIYKPLANESECSKERDNETNKAEEWSGEIYSPESRCFFSNLSREMLKNPTLKSPVCSDWSACPTRSAPVGKCCYAGCRISERMPNLQNISRSVSDSPEGRCYSHRCTGINQYEVKVSGSEWMDCPVGTSIQVPGYRGVVSCPDKRLCLSAPPPQQGSPFYPATRIIGSFATDRPSTDAPSALDSWPLTSDPAPLTTGCADGTAHVQSGSLPGVVTALVLLALLSILLLVCRKRCFYRARVHAVTYIPLVL